MIDKEVLTIEYIPEVKDIVDLYRKTVYLELKERNRAFIQGNGNVQSLAQYMLDYAKFEEIVQCLTEDFDDE